MIKAVIFDVGGVLIKTEDRIHRRELEQQYGMEPGGSDELVFNSEMGQRAQRGEISDEELWNWIRVELDLSPYGITDFRRRFWAGDILDQDLVALVRKLGTGLQTAIISNATDALEHTLYEEHGIGNAFNLIVGSATEGTMKPDAKIYRITLERLGMNAAETVFIDDFAHNVAAAQGLGMHAIHYRPGLDVSAALAALGVTV